MFVAVFTESGFIKRVDEGQITKVRERFAKLNIRALALGQSEIHPDKGLTLYTSAFKPFGMLIKPLSTRLIKLNFNVSLKPRILFPLPGVTASLKCRYTKIWFINGVDNVN